MIVVRFSAYGPLVGLLFVPLIGLALSLLQDGFQGIGASDVAVIHVLLLLVGGAYAFGLFPAFMSGLCVWLAARRTRSLVWRCLVACTSGAAASVVETLGMPGADLTTALGLALVAAASSIVCVFLLARPTRTRVGTC